MVKDIRVRLERHISELGSDISPNWKDMRSGFGYVMLSEIPAKR
jgi:hypothetical protein